MKSLHFGFSLTEALVSIFILSIILIGFDSAEIGAFRNSRDAYYFSVAVNQVNAMRERLQVFEGHSGLEQQIELWNAQNATVLPQGKGEVTEQYIKIKWKNHPWLIEKF